MFRLLRHRHHLYLFRNGFPLTARLAWGAARKTDPGLALWLAEAARHEEKGNGILHFAPKLMARAQAAGIVSERLKVVMRWRHAAHAELHQALWEVVTALRATTGRITLASDLGRVEEGRRTPATAHLGLLAAALAPYDAQAVARSLAPLGWEESNGLWRRTAEARRTSQVILLAIGPDLAGLRLPPQDVFPQAEGLHHLSGPPLALVVARQLAHARSAGHGAQLLDRLVDLLPDAAGIGRFRAYGEISGYRNLSRKALTLLDDLLDARFRGSQEPDGSAGA